MDRAIDMIRLSSHNGLGGAALKTLFLALLMILAGCDWQAPSTLPEQVTGEWHTDDTRYQGRFLKVEIDQITFGLGGVAPDELEHVEKIRMAPADNQTDYVVELKKPSGASDSIALRFTPENGGELRMKNQPKVVWTRKKQPGQALQVNLPLSPTLPLDVLLGEHRAIYEVDCIRPKVCHSYWSGLGRR